MKYPQSLSIFEILSLSNAHSIHICYYSMSQENYRSYHRRGWGYGGGGGGGLDDFAIYMIVGICVFFLFCACISWLVISFTKPCV